MLKINHVTKMFSKGSINEKIALSDLSLEMSAGEFATVVGGNGAGKSTLMNCISGVCDVEQGQIMINQKDVTQVPEYKRATSIGRVFQDPLKGTAFDMTIEENLAIAFGKGKFRGLQPGLPKKDADYFKEQLALLDLGLENRMKHKVGLLSGGQRQALTLLMATLIKPHVLLLDEHTAALDPLAAKKVLLLTDELVKKHHLCTLMITHNMKEALTLGSRTILMHDGKIVLDLKGKERENMTVDQMVALFHKKSGESLYNDRMLLI